MAEDSEIRDELRALGERRKKVNGDVTQLMRDVEDVLQRARGVVSVSEAARLLGLHRTTIHRVYLNK